jgi:hypothetical protein
MKLVKMPKASYFIAESALKPKTAKPSKFDQWKRRVEIESAKLTLREAGYTVIRKKL